jgi:hypothetical protein
MPAAALHGIEDALRFCCRGRHRFFSDDVAAGIERAHDVVVVGRVGRGDDDELRLGFAQHAVKVGHRIGAWFACAGGGYHLDGERGPARIFIANGNDLIAITELAGDGAGVHACARANSHHGVAFARRGCVRACRQHQPGRSRCLQYGAPIDRSRWFFVHSAFPLLLS